MKILGIIPARYDSSRFPGKPLADIMGKTMIQRVAGQVQKCSLVNEVIVATDDERIFENVSKADVKVVMTGKNHQSGTDRIGEVFEKLNAEGKLFDVIVNIQGDEPFIDPKQIEEVLSLFNNPEVQIATLVKKITAEEDIYDPNVVKVVFGNTRQALYFSRSPIPFLRAKTEETLYYKHVGMYAYKSSILKQLVALQTTPLEKAESLEQLRWLEHGFKIHVHITEIESIAIDTPEDLKKLTNNP